MKKTRSRFYLQKSTLLLSKWFDTFRWVFRLYWFRVVFIEWEVVYTMWILVRIYSFWICQYSCAFNSYVLLHMQICIRVYLYFIHIMYSLYAYMYNVHVIMCDYVISVAWFILMHSKLKIYYFVNFSRFYKWQTNFSFCCARLCYVNEWLCIEYQITNNRFEIIIILFVVCYVSHVTVPTNIWLCNVMKNRDGLMEGIIQ